MAEKKKKILIIDDEAHIVDIIETYLKVHGMLIKKAYEGRKALSILKKDKSIDLIILDEKMPGMGGSVFLKELKRIKVDVPIIILTGSLNLSQFDRSTKGLYEKMMIKPVRLSELLKVINRVLGHGKAVKRTRKAVSRKI